MYHHPNMGSILNHRISWGLQITSKKTCFVAKSRGYDIPMFSGYPRNTIGPWISGYRAKSPKGKNRPIFGCIFLCLKENISSYFLSYCDIIGYNYQLDIVYVGLSKTRVYIESIGMSSSYSALILWVIYPIFSYTQLNWRAPNCLLFATEIGVCFQASSSRLVSFLEEKIFWGC